MIRYGTRAEGAVVAAVFLALTLAYSWPLAPALSATLPGDLGDPLLNAWTLAWVADRLAHGFAGLWTAPIFFPYDNTLAFSEHLLGIGVWTAPVQWATGNLVLTYNVAWLGSFVLAGVGMYGLVRALTGRRDAAFVAGVAFAFAPYRLAQVAHLQVLMSGWMPIGLWAIHRWGATGSRAALAAATAAFLLNGLSNGYFLYFFTVPVMAVGLFEVARRRGVTRREAADLLVAAVAILVVIAPVAAAYLDVREQLGQRRTPGEALFFSADLSAYARTSMHSWFWGTRLLSGLHERELFPGITVVALAAAGVLAAVVHWLRGRERGAWPGIVTLYLTIGLAALALTLGPRPSAWGEVLFEPGPYELLRRWVPGWDGFRVPARMYTVVSLALAVLAGFGAARLLPRLGPVVRPMAALALAAAIFAEGVGAVPLVPFDRAARRHAGEVYQWLAAQPPGGVLELPVVEGPVPTLRYQVRTLDHRHPIVNGYSGYSTPLQVFFGGPIWNGPDLEEELDMLRAAGVRYIVFHGEWFENEPVERGLRALFERESPQIEARVAAGRSLGLRLQPPAPPPPRLEGGAVPAGAFRLDASHHPDRVAALVDGDPATRWLTGVPQRGDEWITVDFARARDLVGLRLETGGASWGDYARRLVVEGTSPGGEVRVLFDGPVLPRLVRGLLADPVRAPIEIGWPPTPVAALRIRQTGQSPVWYWSVHELMFYEK